jgi:transposase
MTAIYTPIKLQIGIDVGSLNHSVAISDNFGNIIKEFEIAHTQTGFDNFFKIIEKEAKKLDATISIAMEGYNGWARPLDSQILKRGYKLYNVNNVKLARFKEIFPASAKTDAIDARKIVELFSLEKHLTVAKKVLQEIKPSDDVNAKLKKLTRRRRQLVNEKVAISNRFSSDLQAVAPDLKAITKSIDNLWFLRFITLRDDIRNLARVKQSSILGIKYLGTKTLSIIQEWQKGATFSDELEYTACMIYDDAMRLLELKGKIKELTKQIEILNSDSKIATKLQTIPGFSTISAGELAGEIGTLKRFEGESSLALYLGMTNLDNSSGKQKGSKRNLSTNRHAKNAMITATMKHVMYTDESKKYLNKKISEGKKYQQAIRSIGRHLVRVIWSMIQNDRNYEIR